MKERFVFFEESWNEESTSNRGGKIFDGRTSSTRETEDDTKKSR